MKQIIEYPVPLVLKDILRQKRDGELIIKGDNLEKSLYFLNGDMVFAKTNLIQERLGEILFKIGKIGQSQFWSINKLLAGSNERVGKVLVQNNILTQRDLFLALVYQVRIIAIATFGLFTGRWEFIEKIPKIPEDTNFRIELADLIAEGVKKIRNTAYYRNRYYYHSPKMKAIPENIKNVLSPEVLQFTKLLEEFGNISNDRVVSELKMPQETYWSNVVMLFLLDVLDFSDTKIEEENSKNIDDIIRLYEKLRTGHMDYYDLFGIKSSANSNDIKNVYFDYAKRYHPDRISQAPDPGIREKANYVFSEINKAYETLIDENKRRVYDTHGLPEAGDEAASDKMIERARNLFRKAKTLYDQKKFWEAVTLLEEAIRLNNNKGSYYMLLGICQMELPNMRRVAEKNLQKAVELETYNVDAFAALGLLFIAENQLKRAEGFFRKALSINPDHTVSRKKLNQLLGKDKKKKKFSLFGK